ncbi:MAG: topoisomerase C-terminal repeat-containing protein [Puniceicoccales bacterium]|jgi:DNA topoisomerase-3|nr:topoisomerase C-terminal repeat-containing protein [Puniceicoccales bacterium]
MKTLVIAEKPSVAADLARVLKVPKKDDYYENTDHVIYSAVGHCVELEMPEDIDPKLRHWRFDTLPIVPENFGLKPAPKTRERLSRLKQLLNRRDVSAVVNACDAGREGELIFAYIYQFTKSKLPVKRAWMQTMTADGIRNAFDALRDGPEMAGLEAAARCRSESDWLIGINGTRVITKRMFGAGGKGNVATVGRVQTPTLAIVVKREREIRAFVPRDYWRVNTDFAIANGTYLGAFQRPDFKKNPTDEHDRIERLWNETSANTIADAARAAADAAVTEEKKAATQAAPRLYDLTTLQREANSRFGLPARRTLQIAQALYEHHKVVTYPRTDSRALPEDYIPICKQTLGKLSGDLATHAAKALDAGYVHPNKRIFNNAQISDHFAIIPTGATSTKLDEYESKIYDMIARRFVAAFYPPAEYDVTTRISTITPPAPLAVRFDADENSPKTTLAKLDFKTEGKVLTNPGWLAVYGKTTLEDDASETPKKSAAANAKANSSESAAALPALSAADGKPPRAKIAAVHLLKEVTKPPPRYTEATLLSAMEGAGKLVDDEELGAAMKERGLGTPATRAEIIEGLLSQNYLERPVGRRELAPTQKAETLLDFLAAVGADALTKPDMTGEWEYKLRQMEQGKYKRTNFMSEIVEVTTGIVERTKKYSEIEGETTLTDIPSPTDNKPLIETLRAYKSQDGILTLYKVIAGRKFSIDEIRALATTGEIGPFDDFTSPRTGKHFTAKVRIADDPKKEGAKRAEFDFGEKTQTADLVPFWSDPSGKELCEAATDYVLRAPAAEAGAWKELFKVGRFMCQKEIDRAQAVRLVTEGKTDLIKDFISKKGRPFDAFLVRSGARVRWEFPPRESRAKNGGAAAADSSGADGADGADNADGDAGAKPRARRVSARNVPIDLAASEKIGPAGVEFPNATLFRTDTAYIVVRDYDIDAGDPHAIFRVSRQLCGKELPDDEVRKLTNFGRTEAIEGFVSKHGKPFTAFLVLSKDRTRAEFEFPSR